MQTAPFKSTYAIIDVKTGRQALAKKLKDGGKVRVRVDMILDGKLSIGNDDGVSVEFSGEVTSVKQFRA